MNNGHEGKQMNIEGTVALITGQARVSAQTRTIAPIVALKTSNKDI
ncbi:hypothetical protein [Noviherbaspirillum sedimenti]|nr:hypothetical protein [Noviherbaspirillum sedimenti]